MSQKSRASAKQNKDSPTAAIVVGLSCHLIVSNLVIISSADSCFVLSLLRIRYFPGS